MLLNRLFKQVENSFNPLFFFVWNKEGISLSFNLIILSYIIFESDDFSATAA